VGSFPEQRLVIEPNYFAAESKSKMITKHLFSSNQSNESIRAWLLYSRAFSSGEKIRQPGINLYCQFNQSARDDSVDRPIREDLLRGRLRVAGKFGNHTITSNH